MTAPHEAEAPPGIPDAVPVAVGHDLNVQGQAADFGGWAAYHLTGTEPAQLILPYDRHRHRATIIVGSSAALASFNPTPGAANNPGAATVITSQFLPAGVYTVNWEVMIRGTLSASDANGFQMLLGAAVIATSVNALNVGSVYGQEPVQVTVPAGGATLSIININANAAAVYQAGMVITQDSLGVVYVGTQAQCQQKLGGVLPPGTAVVIENNQALWMAPDGTNPVTVSVLTERWDSGGN